MEKLKALDKVLEPDERIGYFRGVTLPVLHRIASDIKLNATVPEPVCSQFAIATNAYVYSWLFYPFQAAAFLYSILAVELALQLRVKQAAPAMYAGRREPTLYPLLCYALQQRWITDAGFAGLAADLHVVDHIARRFPAGIPDDQRYSYNLLDVLVTLRNDLAHGTYVLAPGMASVLARGAEIINQLFPAEKNRGEDTR